MMKLKSLLVAAICGLAVTASFTSCGDDDPVVPVTPQPDPVPDPTPDPELTPEPWDSIGAGKVAMSRTAAFILNEGSYGKNNTGITYFDWNTDEVYETDFYEAQNGKKLGDTGQDIYLDTDNSLYLMVYGSSYVAALDSFCVEKEHVAIAEGLGQPRYCVADNGQLYFTTYGGYIAKTRFLPAWEGGHEEVQVGLNPEYIIKHDGKLYCTNSGWGKDNRVAIVDIASFGTAEAQFVEVMDNPDHIIEVGGHIFVQGYGAAYDYPWGELKADGTFTQIGNAHAWAAYGDVLYLALSVTDWAASVTTTTFCSYNVKTGELVTTPFMKDAPAELTSSSVYGMNVNPYTGDIYVMTSDFTTNGDVYHFTSDGTFVRKFASTGISPRKIVFLQLDK